MHSRMSLHFALHWPVADPTMSLDGDSDMASASLSRRPSSLVSAEPTMCLGTPKLSGQLPHTSSRVTPRPSKGPANRMSVHWNDTTISTWMQLLLEGVYFWQVTFCSGINNAQLFLSGVWAEFHVCVCQRDIDMTSSFAILVKAQMSLGHLSGLLLQILFISCLVETLLTWKGKQYLTFLSFRLLRVLGWGGWVGGWRLGGGRGVRMWCRNNTNMTRPAVVVKRVLRRGQMNLRHVSSGGIR